MITPRKATGGYTIVETLIYLAVTSALFLAVSIMISGQRSRAEFTQTVRDVESVVRDIVNDTSTGYYPTDNDFQCFDNLGLIQVNSGSPQEQGTNSECIFLGRVLHFPIDSDPQKLTVYTVVGRRVADGTTNNVSAYTEADPTADIDLPNSEFDFSKAISFLSIKYGSGTNIGAFGIYSSLSPSLGSNKSGSLTANLLPITSTSNNSNQNQVFNRINAADISVLNPDEGIIICMQGGDNRYATITVGASNRQLAVETLITDTDCT